MTQKLPIRCEASGPSGAEKRAASDGGNAAASPRPKKRRGDELPAPPEAETIAPAGMLSGPTALASVFAADLELLGEPGEAAPPAAEAAEPPPIDWNQSWYEILGVARAAHSTTIKAAYMRLCALYHPDKAGAAHTSTMQRINHIWSILSSTATRKAYNKNPQDFPFPGST